MQVNVADEPPEVLILEEDTEDTQFDFSRILATEYTGGCRNALLTIHPQRFLLDVFP